MENFNKIRAKVASLILKGTKIRGVLHYALHTFVTTLATNVTTVAYDSNR
jgi:hypothetical protein